MTDSGPTSGQGVDPRRSAESGGLVARVGLALGPLLFAVSFFVPLPEFSVDGNSVAATYEVRVAIGLTLWMACWWMTEALPLAATSLLPLAVLPFFGVMNAEAVAGQYFQDIIALFFGGFCLALAMEKCGLHRRVALVVLRLFGSRPRRVVLGFLTAAALLSMWVSNTATTLMLLPVALAVATGLEDAAGSKLRLGAACALAVSLGASIGGVGTLIGTPPNAYLAQYYRTNFAAEVSAGALPALTFGNWMMIGVPLVVVLVPVAWLILTRVTPRVGKNVNDRLFPAALNDRFQVEARMSFDQWMVMGMFFLTAFLWITHGPIDLGGWELPLTGWDRHFLYGTKKSFITDGSIAMLAAVLLFALPGRNADRSRLLTWDFAMPRLPWGALLLFGGGLALAKSFDASGLNTWLKAAFAHMGGLDMTLLILIVVVAMTIISEIASNTAAAIMMLPILASLAFALPLPLRDSMLPLLMAGALGASCGYALPVATPPNTIAYASGKVRVGEMVKAGLLMDVAAIALMTGVVAFVVPWLFRVAAA